jgi:hypothetical protein
VLPELAEPQFPLPTSDIRRLYRIGHSRLYHKALHDVTAGNNTVRFPPKTINGYHAAPGWDPVTGWGSPNASVLVPQLARSAHPGDAKDL